MFQLIFWVWNLTFMGVMYFWILPEVGFDLWQATRMGEIEPTFIVSLAALLLVPLICSLLGFFRLRRYPVRLMRLFYGVEAPLFTLCLLRLFLLRELTLASGFTLGLVVAAIAMFAIEVLTGYSAYRPRLATVQMISHTLILLVGLYTGALLLLYTVPLLFVMGTGILEAFFDFSWLSGIGHLFRYPGETLIASVFLASVAVFLSMPYVLVTFYVSAWTRIRSAFAKQFTDEKSWTITGVTAVVSLFLFVALQAQPQIKAFRLLAEPSAEVASNPAELVNYRQTQLENADVIKAGLTNAYLHRYRYLSPWEDSNALADFYDYALHLSSGGQQFFQNIHNALISPFLYRGDNSDTDKAKDLYAQFFDAPIQKSEIAAVRSALQATANRDETKAGLLNLDQKVVYLASQSVTVNAIDGQSDWANIEIHEQYENPTFQDQEIFYSFSLPESATITGLWLGDASNPKLFPFVVSPRGAAQQVYNAEVERAQFQRATDPALLEQVGPRQYRLRVFPIPATEPLNTRQDLDQDIESSDSVIAERGPGELHLWMTYQVAQQNGQWPLPQLTEKRNIFWTQNTEHIRGNNSIALEEDKWFESGIVANRAQSKAQPKSFSTKFAEGAQVTAAPFTAKDTQLKNKSLAVVIDSSYSMRTHVADLQQMQKDLQTLDNTNTVDVYLTASETAPKQMPLQDFRQDEIQFYGSLQPADMLQQFAKMSTDKPYNAVLLITDEGSYELAADQPDFPEPLSGADVPLWMVHVGGSLPSAYEDGLLQQLQASQGGVETTVKAALQRLALNSENATAVDGYLWRVDSGDADAIEPDQASVEAVPEEAEANSFEAIAARHLIRWQTRSLDPSNVEALDAVHAIAKRTGIVTPYSSMLVLVDERQREALRAAEEGADRFEREVEDGQDELTNPGNPLTASVPEPGQLLSLMVGAIALFFLKRRSSGASLLHKRAQR